MKNEGIKRFWVEYFHPFVYEKVTDCLLVKFEHKCQWVESIIAHSFLLFINLFGLLSPQLSGFDQPQHHFSLQT